MTSGKTFPICYWCKHFDAEKAEISLSKQCTAFPEGIPIEIWGDEYGPSFDHNMPHPNDNHIQFEKASSETLLRRKPTKRFSSLEMSEKIFQSSLHTVQYNHKMRIKNVLNSPSEPKLLHIIPLDLPIAQSLRDRFKAWNLDLNDPSNQQLISAKTYTQIHENLDIYIQWLEEAFADVKTREEAIKTFGYIVGDLQLDNYPH